MVVKFIDFFKKFIKTAGKIFLQNIQNCNANKEAECFLWWFSSCRGNPLLLWREEFQAFTADDLPSGGATPGRASLLLTGLTAGQQEPPQGLTQTPM